MHVECGPDSRYLLQVALLIELPHEVVINRANDWRAPYRVSEVEDLPLHGLEDLDLGVWRWNE